MSTPVFVLSTGRTGTTFLARAIERLGATSAHEPGPPWLRLASNAYVAGDLSHDRAMRLINRARPAGSLWNVEASCLIYGLAAPILDVFPNAWVVHLVRDPRTYVRSAMNWGVHRPGGRPLNAIPYRRLALPHIEGRNPKNWMDWAKHDQFARICWSWSHMNQAIAAQGSSYDRFLTIRMEDLFDASSNYAGFLQILRIAEISEPDDELMRDLLSTAVNAAQKQSFPAWTDWTEAQLSELISTCGEQAAIFEYDLAEATAELRRTRQADGR